MTISEKKELARKAAEEKLKAIASEFKFADMLKDGLEGVKNELLPEKVYDGVKFEFDEVEEIPVSDGDGVTRTFSLDGKGTDDSEIGLLYAMSLTGSGGIIFSFHLSLAVVEQESSNRTHAYRRQDVRTQFVDESYMYTLDTDGLYPEAEKVDELLTDGALATILAAVRAHLTSTLVAYSEKRKLNISQKNWETNYFCMDRKE